MFRRKKKTGFAGWGIEENWPPISKYGDMQLYELQHEIALLKKDIPRLEKSGGRVQEAKNRLNVLFQLYSEKSGRPLEIVLQEHGLDRE